jgi:hypothetical protein
MTRKPQMSTQVKLIAVSGFSSYVAFPVGSAPRTGEINARKQIRIMISLCPFFEIKNFPPKVVGKNVPSMAYKFFYKAMGFYRYSPSVGIMDFPIFIDAL